MTRKRADANRELLKTMLLNADMASIKLTGFKTNLSFNKPDF